MTVSLAAAAAATLAASFSPDWTTLVALRALTGLALSGVPAVAMAYLAEEMDRSAIGLGGVFLRLKAELNWSRLFQELIVDFSETGLAERQAAAQ